jgi:hypothetical protein
MTNCRYKKILQFYLDGSSDKRHEFKELEEHLKSCLECQVQLAELEELNSAALEIIDEAPEKEYWESFPVRVRNRITARDIEPVASDGKGRAPWYSTLRLASVLVALIMVVGYSFLIIQRGISVPEKVNPIAESPAAADNQVVSQSTAENINPAISQPVGKTESDKVSAAPIGKIETARVLVPARSEASPAEIAMKDIAPQMRGVRPAEISGPLLETEIRSFAPVFAFYLADIDPAFHMKDSFVSQRLLADLSGRPRGGLGGAFQGPGYGFGVPTLDSKVSPTNETQPSWGYTSISSDTSQSAEIRQYFLELELMESK